MSSLRTTLLIGTAAATVVNVAYYVGPLRRLVRHLSGRHLPGPYAERAPAPDAPLSVVIAARNEGANLGAHLPAVLAQAYPSPWEVVVADDASTDATPEVLAKAAQQHERMCVATVTDKTAPGKKQALALAIETARHEWLLATDADCVPASEQWASTMMAARDAGTQLVLGYGPYHRHDGWLNAWLRYETVYTAAQYLSAALAGRPYMGVGRNLLYHRRLYDGAGGFAAHAHLAGGDDDLLVNAAASAKTTAVCVSPAAWVYSEPKRTWGAYVRQKTRHLSVSHVYKAGDQRWIGVLVGSHLLHYAGVGALMVGGAWPAALGLYAVRQAVVGARMGVVTEGLGESDLQRWLPVLDAGVAAYYLGFGVRMTWARWRDARAGGLRVREW